MDRIIYGYRLPENTQPGVLVKCAAMLLPLPVTWPQQSPLSLVSFCRKEQSSMIDA